MDVKIYQPSKTAMQSGRAKAEGWVLEYEQKTRRGPEALMGWTASGDTNNQVSLKFKTLDDAKAFAEKNGWSSTILPPRTRKVKPRNYGDNFQYRPPQDNA